MRPEWMTWWRWRLAWGRVGRRGNRLMFHHPQSSVPGMPWERFEYVCIGRGIWWRKENR